MVKQLTNRDLFNILWYCNYIGIPVDSKCYITLIKKGIHIEKTGEIISFIKKINHSVILPNQTIPGSILRKYPRTQWIYKTNAYNYIRAEDLFKNQKDYTYDSYYTSSLELSTTTVNIPKEYIEEAWHNLRTYKEEATSASTSASDLTVKQVHVTQEEVINERDDAFPTLQAIPTSRKEYREFRKPTKEDLLTLPLRQIEVSVVSGRTSTIEPLLIKDLSDNTDRRLPSISIEAHLNDRKDIEHSIAVPTSSNTIRVLPTTTDNHSINITQTLTVSMANKTPVECVNEDQAQLDHNDRPGFLGVGTNRSYVHKWLQTHAIYGKLMFKNLNYDILNGRFDDQNSYIAVEVITRARVRLAKIPDADNVSMVILMAELHGGFLPDNMYMSTEEAQEEYKRILNALKKPDESGLAMITGQDDYTTSDILGEMHKAFIEKVLSEVRQKWGPTSLMTHSILAYAKRGAVNNRLMQKVQRSVSEELQLEINFEPGVMKTFHTVYGHYVTELNAKKLFTYWSSILPKHALRLTLLVQQTIGSGLTAYYTVMRAVVSYQDFSWDKISKLYASEWADFSTASRAIGANVYYGFKADLQAVRSTKYKNISWVCKELLIRLNGEAALKAYDGWLEKPMYPDVVNGIIDAYVRKYNESKARIPETTEAEKNEVRRVIQDLIRNHEALQITN